MDAMDHVMDVDHYHPCDIFCCPCICSWFSIWLMSNFIFSVEFHPWTKAHPCVKMHMCYQFHPYDTISLISSTSISFYRHDQCLYCKSLSSISNFHSCDQIAFYVFNFIHHTISPSFIHMTHLHCQLHPWTGLEGGAKRGGWDKVWERSHGDKQKNKQTRGVSNCGLAIYIKKYIKAKEEELWKLNYFTMPKYDLPQIL
jgi:hypothetical protein